MTPQEFMAQQNGDAKDYAENLIVQRDDALTRIAGMEAKFQAQADEYAAKVKEQAEAHERAMKDQVDALKAAQELIDSLGGTELGKQMDRDRRRQAAQEQKIQAEAALALIDAEEQE